MSCHIRFIHNHLKCCVLYCIWCVYKYIIYLCCVYIFNPINKAPHNSMDLLWIVHYMNWLYDLRHFYQFCVTLFALFWCARVSEWSVDVIDIANVVNELSSLLLLSIYLLTINDYGHLFEIKRRKRNVNKNENTPIDTLKCRSPKHVKRVCFIKIFHFKFVSSTRNSSDFFYFIFRSFWSNDIITSANCIHIFMHYHVFCLILSFIQFEFLFNFSFLFLFTTFAAAAVVSTKSKLFILHFVRSFKFVQTTNENK